MASKRMFDRSVIETDRFLNVSLSAKAIYFLLGMEADDEGFVSPNRVIRLYGGEAGDIKNLIDVGLIIPFETGVVVITDWNQNNWLDGRRIKPTQYQSEKTLLSLTDTKKYVLSTRLAPAKPNTENTAIPRRLANAKPEERRGEENRIGNTMSAKADRQAPDDFEKFWQEYPKKELKKRSQEIWKAKKLLPHLPKILEFIEKAKVTDRWKRGFIKQPPAFLNGECWNDDLAGYADKFKRPAEETDGELLKAK